MDPRIGDNSASCPECGAPRLDGMTCWDQLGLLLAWEAEDSALAAEHFLTVASYNLQHPAQFTDEALAGLRAAFVEHLDRGMAVVEIRRHAGHAFAGTRRVLRGGRLPSTKAHDSCHRGQGAPARTPIATPCVWRWESPSSPRGPYPPLAPQVLDTYTSVYDEQDR